MKKEIIATERAPRAIGTYSQAVRVSGGSVIYVSGQIPLVPETMEIISNNTDDQINQVFANLSAVCIGAGGGLGDIVRLSVYLTDLSNFIRVNEIMATYFNEPYPARSAIGVTELPKGSLVEVDAIMMLP